MTKENQVNVNPLSNDDLKLWGEFLITKQVPEGKEKQIARLAKRSINLADTSAIMNYLVDFNQQQDAEYMSFLSERIALLEYVVVKKLNISNEEMEKLQGGFQEELKLMEEAYEKLQKEEGQAKDE